MVEPISSGSVYFQSPLRRPGVQGLLFRAGDKPDDPRDDSAGQHDRTGQAESANQADQAGQAGEGRNPHGEERAEVERLKARDAEIRTHGRARAAEAGGQTGSVVYSCRTGPDGNRYAVTSEVDVRLGVVSDNPEATLRNAEAVRQAILSAPGDHSDGDWTIAARAQQEADNARRELNRSTRGAGRPSAQAGHPAQSGGTGSQAGSVGRTGGQSAGQAIGQASRPDQPVQAQPGPATAAADPVETPILSNLV
jgi:hypothetical protein